MTDSDKVKAFDLDDINNIEPFTNKNNNDKFSKSKLYKSIWLNKPKEIKKERKTFRYFKKTFFLPLSRLYLKQYLVEYRKDTSMKFSLMIHTIVEFPSEEVLELRKC